MNRRFPRFGGNFMRVLHSAKRVLAAATLAVFAVGCGKDSNGPEAPFDPAGTSSDMAAVNSSFDAPALASFDAAANEISLTTGGSASLALRARPTAALVTGGKAAATKYAASLAKAFTGGSRSPSFAVAQASIPPELLGTTFVYDVSVQHYAASDLTGAPANGVRFLLYAINPLNGDPVEPLVEIGYADVVTTETNTLAAVSIVVVSENVTYLDYSAQVTASSVNSGNLNVSGYVTNGDDRVNFDLDNRVTFGDTSVNVISDYVLTVPTRGGFRIDLESTATVANTTQNITLSLDLTARGPHGTVNITGTETNGTGTFEVKVNGDLFATIDITAGSQAVVTGANGEALTAEEQAALEDVFYMFSGGIQFFINLQDPLVG
jgi:hypothetical protein